VPLTLYFPLPVKTFEGFRLYLVHGHDRLEGLKMKRFRIRKAVAKSAGNEGHGVPEISKYSDDLD
jgi:hypothetical protein